MINIPMLAAAAVLAYLGLTAGDEKSTDEKGESPKPKSEPAEPPQGDDGDPAHQPE